MATTRKKTTKKKTTKKASARGGSRSKKVKVDFTGVEGSNRVPDNDYAVRSVEVTLESSQEGNPYFNWKLYITEGEFEGKTLWHTTSLQEQALWNLRNTLEAAGQEVPDGAIDFEEKGGSYPELEELEFGVAVENETWQGKKRPRVVDVFPLSEFDADEEGGEGEEEEEAGEEEAGEEEEGAEDEGDEESEVEVGSSVVFESEGENWYGEVTSISEDGETMEVDVDGEVYEVPAEDVYLYDEV